jgi:hypothetical protein
MHLCIKNTLKNNYYRTSKHLEAIPALIYFYFESSFLLLLLMWISKSVCIYLN